MKVTAIAMTANKMDDAGQDKSNSGCEDANGRLLLSLGESSVQCDHVDRTVYSPILSGVVEDFIEGINTEMSAIVAAAAGEQTPSGILSPLQQLQAVKLPSPKRSPSTQASSELDSNLFANEQVINCERKNGDAGGSGGGGAAESVEFTPSSVAEMMATMTLSSSATIASATPNLASNTTTATITNLEGVQHKKSIFDGASKDEILTYLEDAVERVPELLTASDEVMVLGDSDMLLANQLDPSSPVSQLSLVGTSDDLMRSSSERQLPPQARANSPSSFPSTSVLAAGDAIDSISGRLQTLSRDVSRESRRQVGDLFACPLLTQLERQQQQQQQTTTTAFARDIMAEQPDTGQEPLTRTSRVEGRIESGEEAAAGLKVNKPVPSYHQLLFGPTLSDSSNRSCDEADLMSATAIGMASKSMLRCRRSTRRNSISDGGQQVKSERKVSSQRTGLQRHFSKTHDSILISSSSTSPSTPGSSSSPGSTSQSRSSSSNHTASGSCSETSNFYTSPSLSCSSPAIGIDQLAAAAAAAAAANISAAKTSIASPSSDLSSSLLATSVVSPLGIAPVQQMTTNLDLPLVPIRDIATDSSEPIKFDCLELNSTLNFLLNDEESARQIKAPDQCVGNTLATGSKQTGSANQRNDLSKLPDTSTSLSSLAGRKPPSVTPASGRPANSHYATINRLNNYLVNRYRACINLGADQTDSSRASGSNLNDSNQSDLKGPPSMIEFQCLDCDQFILADQSRVLHKANELRLLRDIEIEASTRLGSSDLGPSNVANTTDLTQLNRAYVIALNGLPLCRFCEKKRSERKEIISEFVDTELKYGRDLRIIHDEFYRPMQIAGLLNKDQINGIFSNLDELILVHCKFAECLNTANVEALAYGDTDYNSVHIGKLFLDQADMLQAFEFYCLRQASAACLLARLAKERDLLRIFLRVSQMENPLLRRMNLAAFLMVPVQRVTKYPLLLNRLYKVTPYYHRDREALRAAQLKVELHLEHINHQTKGISATNKIWRRISNLSAGGGIGGGGGGSGSGMGHLGHGGQTLSGGHTGRVRALISAEDISFMKLRKTAMELLKWDRDETQFIHSGELSFAPLNEYLVRQKMKSIRYMPAQALLVTMGKPNLRYMPDLVKSHVDYKLLTPTPGGCGIKEAALLLFREKNGRFVAYREPLFLSNCVLSNDCSQYNIELGHGVQMNRQTSSSTSTSGSISSSGANSSNCSGASNTSSNSPASTSISSSSSQQINPTALTQTNATPSAPLMSRRSSPSSSTLIANKKDLATLHECRPASADNSQPILIPNHGSHHHHHHQQQQQQHSSNLISSNIRSILTSHKTSATIKAAQLKSFSLSSRDSDLSNDQANAQSDSVSMSSLKSLPEERADSSIQKSPPSQASRSNSLASASSQTSMLSSSSAGSAPNPQILPHKSSCTTILNAFKSKSSTSSANQSTIKANSLSGGTDSLSGSKRTTTNPNPPHDNSKASSKQNSAPNGTNNLIGGNTSSASKEVTHGEQHHVYNHHFFHINHQPYGDYEESFEVHERLSKESLLVRADTPLKTRYWLQMLRYHAKDLGNWRLRRPALANIMMMRQ